MAAPIGTGRRDSADRGPLADVGERHPLLVTANRLLAARWLRSLGDDAGAARLLTWYESMASRPITAAWNIAIGRMGLVDRAEIAESIGDTKRARAYLARFLQQYDLAVPSMGAIVARARGHLERLNRQPGRIDRAAVAR